MRLKSLIDSQFHLSKSLASLRNNRLALTMAIDTTDRVARLRALMQKENLHMYVVPSEDAHASEYTAERDLRRQYISGFDGSAGLALITQHQCLLWTDGRYFNQAAQQLDSNWTLMKQGFAGVPTWQEFVLGNVQRNGRVGIDATVIPLLEATSLQRQLAKLGVELVGGKINLIDQIWPDRPPPPAEPVYNHSHATAGRNSADKLADLREFLRSQDAVAFIVTSVDEVCWLFNLRGSDVPFNPVFFSYAIATLDTSVIYADKLIDRGHLPEETEVKPYGRFFPSLHDLPAGKILMSNRASWAIANALKQVEAVKSPIAEAKSVKNDTELTGMRQCHIRDGAALAEFFFDMTRLARDGAQLDEVDAADLLEGKRRAKDKFVGLSFPTISSTGPNGAIIHYRPVKGECAIVDWDAIYLCDSGAQYRDGTTDITRTWHFGRPSDFERKAFTLVLKGHIAIAQLVFPRGTTGYTVDSLARQFLWKEGLDYFHGTSHGVGHFLNVHEPPVGIGTRISFNDVALSPGNVISNEPGFYLDGEFGIRIENIITCRLKRTEHRFGDRDYLAFDTISLHPLCRTMIDVNLLSADEIRWVNAYHVQVLETLGPVVPKEVANWLTDECAPL